MGLLMRKRGAARDLCGRKPNWLRLVGLQQWVDCFTEPLLKHCGINFIDRVCQRIRAIGGRMSAILIGTFENHHNFCELKKAVIVVS